MQNSTVTRVNAFKIIHMISRLCNGAKQDTGTGEQQSEEQPEVIKGDPTDAAFLRFSQPFSNPEIDMKMSQLLASWYKVHEQPFNPQKKWMLTVIRERKAIQRETDVTEDPECWMLVKGAPDVLFPFCSHITKPDGTVIGLDDSTLARVSTLQAEWSNSGLRVLALCRRRLDSAKMNPKINSKSAMEETANSEFRHGGLTLVGLVGIRDPPRADVPLAIENMRTAGVRVFMVTGDFKLTAISIAKQVSVTEFVGCH